jgi:hypothetical protein
MNNILTKTSISKMDSVRIKSLYWDENYTIAQIAAKLGIPFWSLYYFMARSDIARRNRSEAAYISSSLKPQFKIKTSLSTREEKLKIAGTMLYWAEGTLRGNTVDFANSNPNMVELFLMFLRQVCGIDEQRLRLYLYAYPQHDVTNIKSFWSKVTGISLEQFTKPHINLNGSNPSTRRLPYGVVHVRYNDKKLLTTIAHWIDEYVIWAGTQVAKGDRLSKAASGSNARWKSG